MTIMRSCDCARALRRDDGVFFRVNVAPPGRDRVTLCPARGIAGLHGHYKAINHINRAKEAGPGGWYPLCSSEDGQVE